MDDINGNQFTSSNAYLVRYDSQHGIQRLLILYLCLLGNLRPRTLSTPLYLHRWTAGRIQ